METDPEYLCISNPVFISIINRLENRKEAYIISKTGHCKAISERYKQTGEVTDEDWEFCEQIDWHPVDELPMKESFIKELEEAKKEPSIRLKSVSEIWE